MRNSKRNIAACIAIGVVAGLRSMMAPALVSWGARREWILPSGRLQFLRKPIAGYAFGAVAAGELVADKLPGTPNRTEPFALAARALSGALSGAALWRRDRCAARGAVLGAAGAMMGAFAGYEIRRTLGQKLDVPDGLIAAAEDAIAVSGGLLVIDMSAR